MLAGTNKGAYMAAERQPIGAVCVDQDMVEVGCVRVPAWAGGDSTSCLSPQADAQVGRPCTNQPSGCHLCLIEYLWCGSGCVLSRYGVCGWQLEHSVVLCAWGPWLDSSVESQGHGYKLGQPGGATIFGSCMHIWRGK